VEGSITVASLEGQIITRLIGVPAPYPPSPEVYSSSKLSWSPDGSRLAYPTSTGDLAIVEIVSETQTVFDLGKYDTIWGAVSWLIGGTGLVAFDDGELVIIHTDGSIGEKRRVTVDGGVPGFDPTVSRDGRMLAFLSEPYGFACMDGPCIQSTNDSHPQLYVMGIQDTLATRLTESGTMKCRPTWSPDGSWLAYAEQQNGGWDLFALSVEGGMVRQLTRGPALDFDPNWGQGQPTAVPSLSWAKVKELIR
jgi:dipeptidyl aminopeptidase/acylaminoacyl peptidase